MSTERIDIVVSERGSRTVKRNLDEIGQSGIKAGSGVQLLQRALAGLAVGSALTFLQRQADLYTNIQNRLKLVTSGTEELSAVTQKLFDVSNRTRQSYESTAGMYSRVALATRELGLSQQDLLGFTESLNQAVVLSGASAVEAEAAMIQLSQGLASGALRGDELRSVLEQLPYVADVIAKGMGVTRGELRKLGEDGKISAAAVINAFRDARTELNEKFAKTIPTISQSFTVLQNKLLEFIGTLDAATGASANLSRLLILVSNNLGLIAAAIATAAIAFIGLRAAMGVQFVVAYIASLVRLEIALGATSVRAALAGITMKGFQAVLAAVTSTAALLTAGLVLVSAGLVALASEASSSNAIIASLTASGNEAANMLADARQKAVLAGVAINSTGAAGNYANPIMAGLALAYKSAADMADRLANSARQAAIAVAQGKILELQAKKSDIMSPITQMESADGAMGGGGMGGLVGAVRQYGSQYLFGGPSVQQRREQAGNIDAQIGALNQTIDIYKKLPEQSFAPKPIGGAAVAKEATKKTAPASTAVKETRDDFLSKVNRETDNSIKLAQQMNFEWLRTNEVLTGVDEQLIDRWGKKAALSDAERTALGLKVKAMFDEQRLQERTQRLYEDFSGPQKDMEEGHKAIQKVIAKYPQYAEEANNALRAMRIEFLQTKRDLASGLELGKLQVQDDNSNVARRVASAYTSEYDAVNNGMREIQDRAAALKQLMVDDPINSGQYAQRLQELGLEALQLKVNMPGADTFDAVRGALANFVSDFKGVLPGLQRAFGTAFNRIGDGIANALSRGIVYGENMGKALKEVAASALTELLSALIKLGIQWVVMQVIGQTAQAAIGATGIAMGAATAAAWAPAAAAVSLATFGANAGPAMAGIGATYALTTALSAVKGFREGGFTGNGGRGDVAGVVHGQEFVMNADATAQWFPILQAMNAGRMAGYANGGYTGGPRATPRLAPMGVVQPQASNSEGSMVIQIDARGAEEGVERKIEQALNEALPVFLAKSRVQEAKVNKAAAGRRSIGSVAVRRR